MKKQLSILALLFICSISFSQDLIIPNKNWKPHIEIQIDNLQQHNINEISGKLIVLIPKDTVINTLMGEEKMRYYVPHISDEIVVNHSNTVSLKPAIITQGYFESAQMAFSQPLRFITSEMKYNQKVFIILEEVVKSTISSTIIESDLKNAINIFKKRKPTISEDAVYGVVKNTSLISVKYSISDNNESLQENFKSVNKLEVEIQLSDSCNERLIRQMIEKTKATHPDKLDQIFSYEDYQNFDSEKKNEINMRILTLLEKLTFPNKDNIK